MKISKRGWFLLIITLIIIIILIIVIYPKSCGGGMYKPGPQMFNDCKCIGFTKEVMHIDSSRVNCFGICLKNTCKIIPKS
jgi:hypothetical protein